MKTLSDGTQVLPRTWYYLLDFNDCNNRNYMINTFSKFNLHELTKEEYLILFAVATNIDKLNLEK